MAANNEAEDNQKQDSSVVLVDEDTVREAEADHAKQLADCQKRHERKMKKQQQRSTPPGGVIASVSLFAVKLSSLAAENVVSAAISARLMAAAPASLVAAQQLYSDINAVAMGQLTSSLVVHIPSDAITAQLVKKLVLRYCQLQPELAVSVNSLSPSTAAGVSALGGALPLLVAAALQESIEVSKLVTGQSSVERFARASAFVSAQLAGGVLGMAAGAAAGTALLPGVGTGLGGVAGSWAGSTLLPMLLGSSSSSSQPSSSPPDSSSAMMEATAVSDVEVFKQNKETQLSFFWAEEVTSDGFVLVSPESVLVDEKAAASADDDSAKELSQEQIKREFDDTAKALLHRASVIPMARALAEADDDDDDDAESLPPAEQSRRALQFVDALPGMVLMLQPGDATAAAAANSGSEMKERSFSASRIFLDESGQQQQQQSSASMLLGRLRGRTWGTARRE
jgi:hypothetical protein